MPVFLEEYPCLIGINSCASLQINATAARHFQIPPEWTVSEFRCQKHVRAAQIPRLISK